jgi:dTMP kinase
MMNKKSLPRPKFISFEGGEGAGKSSLMNRIGHMLQTWKIDFIKTREPGGTVFGEQLRHWILSQHEIVRFDAKAELLLFLAARAQHIEEKIAPAIQKGVLVLCDRFNDSTIAYQGVGRNLGMEWVRSLCETICGGIKPDLTFYLDVDPSIGLIRTSKAEKENASSGKLDRMESEKLEFHQNIRKAFHLIVKAEPERFCLIDASQSMEAVFESAKHQISMRFSHV